MANMSSPHQVFDAVIFGSGLAGLSCARRLAMQGKKTLVVEKSKEIGGHLLPFERAGAFFEVGLHYIADTQPGGHYHRAMSDLGIQLEEIQLDEHFETLHFEHMGDAGIREFSYTRPLSLFITQLLERFPAKSREIKKYFEIMESVWAVMRKIEFPVTILGALRAFKSSENKMAIGKAAFQTLGECLDELKIHGDLREVLVMHHVLIGVPPSRVSAVLHMVVQRYYFEGACFVRGGGKAVIDALIHSDVEYVVSCDAQFECDHRVESKQGRARYKVHLQNGRTVVCNDIVWTPDPRLLPRAAQTINLPTLLRERLKRAETPHALVVGYFATRRPLPAYGLKNCNHWLMGRFNSEACYLERDPVVLAENAPLYVSTGSLRDPDALREQNKLGAQGVFQAMFLCPAESSIWGGDDVSVYRTPESKGGFGRNYRNLKQEVLKTLTDRLQRSWPELTGELVWTELGTPLTHHRYLNSLTLNGYGFAPTVQDLLWRRPGVETGVEGLYLCGAHTRPSHGIVTALLNGVGLANSLCT